MRRYTRALLAVLAMFVPRVAWACTYTGPDAEAFYAALERPAYTLWAISGAAAILWLLLRRRHRRFRAWALPLLGLTALQPAWWIPGNGDCGALRGVAASLVAALSIALLVVALVRTRGAAVQDREAGV